MQKFVSAIRIIPQTKFGVSEPNPSWFGNPKNEITNSHWTNQNWLKSRFHFSFAEYSNPKNNNFGVLRVLNDDLVQPNRGFGEHPHRDVEICTYVVNGKLTHEDSMGTKETIDRGAIQFMTAGSGVSHSEHNWDKENPLRFIQIWITTRQHGLKPNYGSMLGNPESRLNKWAHYVSDVNNKEISTPIKINQDCNIFVSEIMNEKISFEIKSGRQAYLVNMEGDTIIEVDGDQQSYALSQHDAAELYGPLQLQFTQLPNENPLKMNSHLILIEMAATGKGRSDL